MSKTAAMEEIRACIRFYDKRGWDWTDAVTYISICHAFGSWHELVDFFRTPHRGRPRR